MNAPVEAYMKHLLPVTLAFLSLSLSSELALAHEWYPASCCSERDCRALVETNGETVLESADGWKLWDGRTVPRGRAKFSPDWQFHLCETPAKSIICFFAPPGAS